MTQRNHLMASILFLGLFLSVSCNSEKADWDKASIAPKIREMPQKDWERAQSINTVEGYQKFIKAYPSSEYAKSATEQIVQLDLAGSMKSISLKQYPEAKRLLEQALALDPNNPLVLNNYAVVLATTGYGEFDQAESYFKKALSNSKSLSISNRVATVVLAYKSFLIHFNAVQQPEIKFSTNTANMNNCQKSASVNSVLFAGDVACIMLDKDNLSNVSIPSSKVKGER